MAKKKNDVRKDSIIILTKLQVELRELDTNWITKLEQQILADETVDNVVKEILTVRKIYNVFHNIVRNHDWRMLIITQSKKLKSELEKQIKKAIA